MKFKTKGGVSPQGIPKIYYTAYPKDFSLYFDYISDLLLNHQNCTVFFDEDPENPEDGENFYSLLHDMQLIVIPITSNFLERDCLARSGVFSYAMEQHIPVLPILEESGIEEKFNEICGDLQFLDPYERDLTAVPFEEKLSKYLSSVLIGDELAEKIRNTFDAYIFMSYRKKDRKEAQKLMKMIHENPFCRDIAIWYDEYLVPGENFNQAIQKAMQKSDLFTLTVTPNLLENPNYVMQHEFPDARDAGMKILPVEMQETNQEQLKADYSGLPECIRPDDTETLSEKLFQSFGDISEINHSSEHEFFIGLAYLGGVDVEINHERALELITSAAEKELPEAVEKLVSMYRNGEGVKRNYETAISWQKKLVDLIKKQFEREQSEELALDYANSMWDLGDFIEEVGHMAEAETVYREALSICEQLDRIFDSDLTKMFVAEICNRLGDVCKTQYNMTGAREFFEKSLEISKYLAEQTDSVREQRDLSINYNKLGLLCKFQGDIAGAKEFCEKSLAVSERLAKQSDSSEAKRLLLISYCNIGDICTEQGNFTGARAFYEEELAVTERLAEQTDPLETDMYYVSIYIRFGDLCLAQRDLTGAREFYEKSLEIYERPAGQPISAAEQKELDNIYTRLGYVYLAQGDTAGAKTFFGKGIAI